jgi:SOS-response transcriptional repressor LexA
MSGSTEEASATASLSATGPPQGAKAPSGGSAANAVASVGACSGSEAFALRVLGTSMEPEFMEGEIIVIEPEGLVRDGSFVLAQHAGEWIFRQLCQQANGWTLHALNPAFADRPLPDLAAVRGVIIQKALPGRRRASKRYV